MHDLGNLISGGIAGAVSRTIVSPLERIKILSQISESKPLSVSTYLSNIYKQEGVRGFYRGNGANILRIVPYTAIQFASYEKYKKVFSSGSTIEKLLSGGLAGVTSVVATYPLDLVRTRMSLQGETLSIVNTLKSVYITEGGVLGLYRGIVPTIIGIAPYVAINFTLYETMKKRMTNCKYGEISFNFVCGGVSSGVAQTMTYPLDVLRRRMQIDNMKTRCKYRGMVDCFTSIIRNESVFGLYKGLTPNLLKIVPSMSTTFVVYEYLRKRF